MLTKTPSTPHIDLRCFVARQFLLQIYVLLWCTIYRPENAVEYKKSKYEVYIASRWKGITSHTVLWVFKLASFHFVLSSLISSEHEIVNPLRLFGILRPNPSPEYLVRILA